MLGVSGQEFLIIAAITLLVLGPKDFPRALRLVGQWTGKMQKLRRELQGQFNSALREAEFDDLKKDVEALGKIDPLAGVGQKLGGIENEVRTAITQATPGPKPDAAEIAKPGS
jgi:sec-independent protein translocase protein TatB